MGRKMRQLDLGSLAHLVGERANEWASLCLLLNLALSGFVNLGEVEWSSC